jgi:hypothetical protein
LADFKRNKDGSSRKGADRAQKNRASRENAKRRAELKRVKKNGTSMWPGIILMALSMGLPYLIG